MNNGIHWFCTTSHNRKWPGKQNVAGHKLLARYRGGYIITKPLGRVSMLGLLQRGVSSVFFCNVSVVYNQWRENCLKFLWKAIFKHTTVTLKYERSGKGKTSSIRISPSVLFLYLWNETVSTNSCHLCFTKRQCQVLYELLLDHTEFPEIGRASCRERV